MPDAGPDLVDRADELARRLAEDLALVDGLLEALGRGSPARQVALTKTKLQEAALWFVAAHAELRGGMIADQVIVDALLGI